MNESEKIKKIQEIHEQAKKDLAELAQKKREVVAYYIEKLDERKVQQIQQELKDSFKAGE